MSHELSIEEYIARQPEYDKARRIMHPLLRALAPTFCKVDICGLENVPRRGPTCLMINHVSYLDPIVVTVGIPFRYTISLSKVENFSIPVAGWFLRKWGHYPIHRGEYDRRALRQTIALLKSGQMVLMAPEGTRHPAGHAAGEGGLGLHRHQSRCRHRAVGDLRRGRLAAAFEALSPRLCQGRIWQSPSASA